VEKNSCNVELEKNIELHKVGEQRLTIVLDAVREKLKIVFIKYNHT
jgi:biotin synthase-related radical SAM superfamily protein